MKDRCGQQLNDLTIEERRVVDDFVRVVGDERETRHAGLAIFGGVHREESEILSSIRKWLQYAYFSWQEISRHEKSRSTDGHRDRYG